MTDLYANVNTAKTTHKADCVKISILWKIQILRSKNKKLQCTNYKYIVVDVPNGHTVSFFIKICLLEQRRYFFAKRFNVCCSIFCVQSFILIRWTNLFYTHLKLKIVGKTFDSVKIVK